MRWLKLLERAMTSSRNFPLSQSEITWTLSDPQGFKVLGKDQPRSQKTLKKRGVTDPFHLRSRNLRPRFLKNLALWTMRKLCKNWQNLYSKSLRMKTCRDRLNLQFMMLTSWFKKYFLKTLMKKLVKLMRKIKGRQMPNNNQTKLTRKLKSLNLRKRRNLRSKRLCQLRIQIFYQ